LSGEIRGSIDQGLPPSSEVLPSVGENRGGTAGLRAGETGQAMRTMTKVDNLFSNPVFLCSFVAVAFLLLFVLWLFFGPERYRARAVASEE
jgi:hypothetical protein